MESKQSAYFLKKKKSVFSRRKGTIKVCCSSYLPEKEWRVCCYCPHFMYYRDCWFLTPMTLQSNHLISANQIPILVKIIITLKKLFQLKLSSPLIRAKDSRSKSRNQVISQTEEHNETGDTWENWWVQVVDHPVERKYFWVLKLLNTRHAWSLLQTSSELPTVDLFSWLTSKKWQKMPFSLNIPDKNMLQANKVQSSVEVKIHHYYSLRNWHTVILTLIEGWGWVSEHMK